VCEVTRAAPKGFIQRRNHNMTRCMPYLIGVGSSGLANSASVLMSESDRCRPRENIHLRSLDAVPGDTARVALPGATAGAGDAVSTEPTAVAADEPTGDTMVCAPIVRSLWGGDLKSPASITCGERDKSPPAAGTRWA